MERARDPWPGAGVVGMLASIVVASIASMAVAQATASAAPVHPTPPPMRAVDLQEFLTRPLVAHLAVVRANGTPQVVPMWFLYKDGVFYMSTRTYAAKLKHIQHNPRVAVVIDVMEAPLKNKSVTVDGTVEVQRTGVKDMTTAIYRKYVGEAGLASAAAQRNINDARVILKIVPKKVVSIDTTH